MLDNEVLSPYHTGTVKNDLQKNSCSYRSFGVFIINKNGEMLVQKRSKNKPTAAGLWENACSSSPKHDEKPEDAAHRRLREELGFDCPLQEAFTFFFNESLRKYAASSGHEFYHVFIGISNQHPQPNYQEIEEIRWIELNVLLHDINNNPWLYSHWFKETIDGVALFIKKILFEQDDFFQSSSQEDFPPQSFHNDPSSNNI